MRRDNGYADARGSGGSGTAEPRVVALAEFLQTDPWRISRPRQDPYLFEVRPRLTPEEQADPCTEIIRSQYWVLSVRQANRRAAERIPECLWELDACLLVRHIEWKHYDDALWLLQRIQQKQGHRGNALLRALVPDLRPLVRDAIATYGRGRFLSRQDEREHRSGGYLIYLAQEGTEELRRFRQAIYARTGQREEGERGD